MFSLNNKILIRGFDAHIKAGLGGAADYEANYIPFYIPFDGVVQNYYGHDGGNWLRLTRPNGDKIELAHLSKYYVNSGNAVAGQLGGVTGNTGAITTGPHLHIQIFNKQGVRLDPEKYTWLQSLNKTFMKVTLVANNITWDYKPQLVKVSEWFKTYSNNKLEVVFDSKDVSFDTVPLAPFLGMQAVDINWYRQNITPLATGEATVLLLNPDQYQNPGTWGFMTYGDSEKPVRMEVACDNSQSSIDFPEAHLVVHRIFHEICHALYFLTGQPDRVHELLFVPEAQLPLNRSALLNEIDYVKLQAKLLTIKPMANQARVVKSKTSNTVWICQPVPDMDYLTKKANLEGIILPDVIPDSDTL